MENVFEQNHRRSMRVLKALIGQHAYNELVRRSHENMQAYCQRQDPAFKEPLQLEVDDATYQQMKRMLLTDAESEQWLTTSPLSDY